MIPSGVKASLVLVSLMWCSVAAAESVALADIRFMTQEGIPITPPDQSHLTADLDWQWHAAPVSEPEDYQMRVVATSQDYTPKTSDVGNYLRVCADAWNCSRWGLVVPSIPIVAIAEPGRLARWDDHGWNPSHDIIEVGYTLSVSQAGRRTPATHWRWQSSPDSATPRGVSGLSTWVSSIHWGNARAIDNWATPDHVRLWPGHRFHIGTWINRVEERDLGKLLRACAHSAYRVGTPEEATGWSCTPWKGPVLPKSLSRIAAGDVHRLKDDVQPVIVEDVVTRLPDAGTEHKWFWRRAGVMGEHDAAGYKPHAGDSRLDDLSLCFVLRGTASPECWNVGKVYPRLPDLRDPAKKVAGATARWRKAWLIGALDPATNTKGPRVGDTLEPVLEVPASAATAPTKSRDVDEWVWQRFARYGGDATQPLEETRYEEPHDARELTHVDADHLLRACLHVTGGSAKADSGWVCTPWLGYVAPRVEY